MATTLSLISRTQNPSSQCPILIDVLLDTHDQDINTIDMKLFSDDSLFRITDFTPNTQTFPISTPPIYGKALHTTQKGKNYRYTTLTSPGKQGFNGQEIIGTLTVVPGAGVQQLDLNRYAITGFDGDDTSTRSLQGNAVLDTLTQADSIHLPLQPAQNCENIVTTSLQEHITLPELSRQVIGGIGLGVIILLGIIYRRISHGNKAQQ